MGDDTLPDVVVTLKEGQRTTQGNRQMVSPAKRCSLSKYKQQSVYRSVLKELTNTKGDFLKATRLVLPKSLEQRK